MPAGILFTAEEKTVYHAGDTALFSDMKLIGELNKVDLAFYQLVIISQWKKMLY